MTPWQLAQKTEHSHQRALFAWANCAALYGFGPARVVETYSLKTRQAALDAYALADTATGAGLSKPQPLLRLLFAVHNQGHGDAVRGARAKAEGVKPGVPDVMLPVVRRFDNYAAGLFVELKLPNFTLSAVSEDQTRWHDELKAQGYRVEVCGGWQAAANVIERYMSWKRN